MKRAIYLRLIALTAVAVLICGFVSAMIHAIDTQNQTEEWLKKLTLLAVESYERNSDARALAAAAGNNRITIIAPDGTVLADSEADAAAMESHADREEVQYAKRSGVTIVIRASQTLGTKFMYASIVAGDGNIVRLAYSYAGLLQNLAVQLPAMLFAMAAALLLSLLLAGRFTKTVINPLENILASLSARDYAKLRDYKSPYYEIDKMMHTLRELLQKITDSNVKLQSERENKEYILSNMAEGLVLLDGQKRILLCNNSARAFFGCGHPKPETLYHLTRNHNILSGMQLALESGQSSIFDLALSGRIVNVYISPSGKGASLLMVDMTAEKQLEQQKRDFFSNASHELRTPVTSILGFSELLNAGMIGEEQQADIIKRMEVEARRLSELINDILTISKLESGGAQVNFTEINFSGVIREAVNSICTDLEIHLALEDILLCADKKQIYELCVNLIENAVKYNKPNGKVYVALKRENGSAILNVKDTGIGIPPEYQARVFERFFRVDYGRDKKVGGTGLGLSIVKHIVSTHEGKVLLQSKLGNGTEITVSLPL